MFNHLQRGARIGPDQTGTVKLSKNYLLVRETKNFLLIYLFNTTANFFWAV